MPPDLSPFGDLVAPGTRLTNLHALTPLAARTLDPSWRNEVVLVSLDDQWRSQPGLTIISDLPSLPELLESFLTWLDPLGRSVPDLLGMHRLVCVSQQVPYRIDPAFDWFDCDHIARTAGVHLVEWIALDADRTLLPRVAASVEPRWPTMP